MAQEYFRRRFPEMTPVDSVPPLFSFLGCGLMFTGRSKICNESGTYVVIYAFCLFYLPLLTLRSYRVMKNDDGNNRHLLGRVPSLRIVKIRNVCSVAVALIVMGGGIWYYRTQTPDALAARKILAAQELASSGRIKEAAEAYRDIADAGRRSMEANRRLEDLFDNLSDDADEVAGAFDVAVELHRKNRPIRPDLSLIGRTYASKKIATDPAGALKVLDRSTSLLVDSSPDDTLREKLLEVLAGQDPQNFEYAIRWAEYLEKHGDYDKCEKLLIPFESRLGSREGAAILGRILAAKGEVERAYALLSPYVESNLQIYLSAEKACRDIPVAMEKRAFNSISNGTATEFDFPQYRSQNAAGRDKMYKDYLKNRLAKDLDFQLNTEIMRSKRTAIAAALDLGMLQLTRGRAIREPIAREAELKRAEKTFLSIQSSAGETENFKFRLGQVYYWLSKAEEGRKLFHDLLISSTASVELKVAVAQCMQEVGLIGEARSALESIYAGEFNIQKKQMIASVRALMGENHDDAFAWNQKADVNQLGVKAALFQLSGVKAHSLGRREEAITNFMASIETYDSMPEDYSALNNCASALIGLYRLTGETETFARAAAKLDRSIAVNPRSSIVIENALSITYETIPQSIVGNSFDLKALDRTVGWDMLEYLIQDEADYSRIYSQVRKHFRFSKSRTYAEKLVLLAPKSPIGYHYLKLIIEISEDEKAMEALLARIAQANLPVENSQKYLEYLNGKNDESFITAQKSNVVRTRMIWEATRHRKDITSAIAACDFLRSELGRYMLGERVDADILLKIAEEAVAVAPSLSTRAALRRILQYQAHLAMIAADADYKSEAERTHRSFGIELFNLTLMGQDSTATKARSIGKRYMDMHAELYRQNPNRCETITPYLLGISPLDVARDMKTVKLYRRISEIDFLISPINTKAAQDIWFAKKADGNEKEAAEILKKLRLAGVPVPRLPE